MELGNTGLSILEMSHRSKEFVAIMEEARALALELSGLTGKGYQALFLHGGASLHFYASALNLLERKGHILILVLGRTKLLPRLSLLELLQW